MTNTRGEGVGEGVPNMEKTWRDVIQEVDHNPSVLWNYVTILRGPDMENSSMAASLAARLVLTCPLRCRCERAADVEDFLALTEKDIEGYFKLICAHKNEFFHYLSHIVAVWLSFYQSLGGLLLGVLLEGGCADIKKVVRRYMELINEWLHSPNVVMRCSERTHKTGLAKM